MLVHYNSIREGNGAGGAESAVHDQAKALRALGHEVEIEHEFPQQAYRRFKPDIIHFHTIHIGELGLDLLEWAQNKGIPHCLSLHDYWPFCNGRMLLKRGDEPCSAVRGVCDGNCEFGKPNASVAKCVNGTPTVTFNPYSADIYRRNGIRVDAMIPHGVDTDLFSPADGGSGIVTSSAWPEYPTKGMHVLKAALAKIGESAKLITGVPRVTVRDELRKGSIFVFPSCYEETFGLCLCEAMACGLTPVASDVCGARSQITHGQDGFLVPPRDSDRLADALQWLLTHDAEREAMGKAARHKAETQFNLQRMARDYERFYGEVIHG